MPLTLDCQRVKRVPPPRDKKKPLPVRLTLLQYHLIFSFSFYFFQRNFRVGYLIIRAKSKFEKNSCHLNQDYSASD